MSSLASRFSSFALLILFVALLFPLSYLTSACGPPAQQEKTTEKAAETTADAATETATEATPETATEATPETATEATPETATEATPEIATEATPEATGVSLKTDISPMFSKSGCYGCHGGSGGFSMSQATLHASIVNKASSQTTPYITPKDTAKSYIYLKMTNPPAGGKMPQGGSASAADIKLLEDWINQGALDN